MVTVMTLVSLGLIYTCITALLTRKYFDSQPSDNIPLGSLPAVSILKPIKGIDDQLETNLRSFFTQKHPQFELLFGISNHKDPAIAVVQNLQKQYPDVACKLIIGDAAIGLNPKVNILYNLFPRVQHNHILISDSNIRVKPNYLQQMMRTLMQPGVGLVTSVFRGAGARSLGAKLENLHLNTFVAGNVIATARLFRRPITIGKSMLFRKEVVNQLSGFSSLANVLAEDHMLGLHIQKLGLSTRVSPGLIDNHNELWRIDRFLNRHIRWAQMRKSLNILHYCLELIINPVFVAFMYALASLSIKGWLLFAMTSVIKILIDLIIALAIDSRQKLYDYLLIPIKDILLGFLWLIPFINNKINWRGSTFRIAKGTQLLPYHKGI
jgi:ceramide glucosyltransferase